MGEFAKKNFSRSARIILQNLYCMIARIPGNASQPVLSPAQDFFDYFLERQKRVYTHILSMEYGFSTKTPKTPKTFDFLQSQYNKCYILFGPPFITRRGRGRGWWKNFRAAAAIFSIF